MSYSSEPPEYIEIIWSSEWKSWGMIPYSHHGDQTAEGQWEPYKDEAIAAARQFRKTHSTVNLIRVFAKNNDLIYNLYGRNS